MVWAGAATLPLDYLLLSLNELFIYVGVVIVFFMFLVALLRMARTTLSERHATLKEDEFFKAHGYSYDFAFVFKVWTEEEKDELNRHQLNQTMKGVINALQNAMLETSCFYSCQRDEIYVKVRANPDRLKKEAFLTEYKLMLDAERLQIRINSGKKNGMNDDGSINYKWRPFTVTDEFNVSSYSPWEYIFAPFKESEELQSLYRTHEVVPGIKSLFTEVDRLKLIQSIISRDCSGTLPGAGLNIKHLLAHEVALAFFPIHNMDKLKALQRIWLSLFSPPSKQPVTEIKDYFGEKIGFYFLYAGAYVGALVLPAAIGCIVFIIACIEHSPETELQPYFGIFMILWYISFIESFKNRQTTMAMQWGVLGFESEEQPRPHFKGQAISSPVDGSDDVYYPYSRKLMRSMVAYLAVGLCLLAVIGIIGCIFGLQWLAYETIGAGTIGDYDIVHFITAVAFAFFISVNSRIFKLFVEKLNAFENHRTQTDYDDYLVAKVYLFQFVNSYTACFGIAFVKPFLNVFCTFNNCIQDLESTITVIFVIGLFERAFEDVIVRKYLQGVKSEEETSGLEPGSKASVLEKQYILSEYSAMNGIDQDYAGLFIQLGFALLFAVAFPAGPVLALMGGFTQLRIDGWKLCQAFRRPVPEGAEDIGMWLELFEMIAVAAITFNLGLIFLSGHFLPDTTWERRWIFFMVTEQVMLVLKVGISVMTDDVPEEITIQASRQEYLVNKAIENEDDDDDPEFEVHRKMEIINITNTDLAWIMPDVYSSSGTGTDDGDDGIELGSKVKKVGTYDEVAVDNNDGGNDGNDDDDDDTAGESLP